MTLDEELRLSYYQRIAPLNAEHGVYLAQHVSSGRVFVMKELITFNRDVFLRLREKPVPGVPRIYEAVESEDKLIVIEEYVNAEPLSELLERRGTLTRGEALMVIRQLAEILSRLHSMEPPVIHRDIKPSNVLVSDEGRVTLIDLDAAKACRPGESRDTELIGTAGYAAPEQYGFAASSPETDIYALGVLLSVMLTGKLPNEAQLEGSAARIVKKCTAIEPGKRYRSAEAVVSAIDPVIKTKREHVKGAIYRPLGFRSLTPWKMLIAAAVYGLLLAFCITVKYLGSSGLSLWMKRLASFLLFMWLILFPSNYGGVLDKLGINRVRTVWARVLLIIVFTALYFLFLVFILSRFE